MTSTKFQEANAEAFNARARRIHWTIDDLRNAASSGRGVLYFPRHATFLCVAAVVLLIGLGAPSNIRLGLTISTVYAIAIVGNNAVHAVFGELNISSGVFMALGAYVCANGLILDQSLLVTVLAAMVVTAVVGAIVALPMLRLHGIAVPLLTFTLAYSVPDLAIYFEGFTGGDVGKYLPFDLGLGPLTFSGSSKGMLLLSVVIMVLVGGVHLALLHSRLGRTTISVGEVSTAAAVFATRVRTRKLMVWAWAATLGGLAGSLYGLTLGYVTASQWTFMLSIFVLAGGLIGGTRSASGAWVGGILVGGLPLWLQNVVPPAATNIVYGVILILALLAGGKGLSGFVERILVESYGRIRRRR